MFGWPWVLALNPWLLPVAYSYGALWVLQQQLQPPAKR